jgi:hypothetical protein
MFNMSMGVFEHIVRGAVGKCAKDPRATWASPRNRNGKARDHDIGASGSFAPLAAQTLQRYGLRFWRGYPNKTPTVRPS